MCRGAAVEWVCRVQCALINGAVDTGGETRRDKSRVREEREKRGAILVETGAEKELRANKTCRKVQILLSLTHSFGCCRQTVAFHIVYRRTACRIRSHRLAAKDEGDKSVLRG